MLQLAKIGAALFTVGLLALPTVFWLGPAIGLLGTSLAVVGLILMLWSRSKAAGAARIGTGGIDRDANPKPPGVN